MKRDLFKLENISDKFNKIGSKPKFNLISIQSIIIDVVDYYKSKLPKSSNIAINIKSNIKDGVKIEGDKILLYWAFENIIKNSIDSIENHNGKINIKIAVLDNRIKILFIDNGLGISRNNKNNIFKPGFSTKSKGWGIGLNLSKRIVEYMHKGSLKLIKSNHEETMFEVILNFSIS